MLVGDQALELFGGELRIRLVVRVANLDRSASYRAETFNPITGKTTTLGPIKPDAQSGWTASAPTQSDAEDWVLVIERQ